MSSKSEMPHSGHYFGDQRDFWWNYDFLELMAKRWDLKKVESMLDVGCGIGHWKNAKIVGIDPEPKWIEKVSTRAKEMHLKNPFEGKIAQVEHLPFEDNLFDMVTCQTVLIHVNEVSLALKEMIRVLKPGGLLAVAEPNNIASMLVFNSESIHEPVEPLLEHVQFHIKCERGKQALGMGYNSIGDILPYEFAKQNLEKIQVYLSDKTSPFIPPYASKEEQVLINQMQEWQNQEILVWPKEETRRYFLAGGGKNFEFERIWPKLIKDRNESLIGIKNKSVSSPGTSIMYLISGRKKLPA
jgi:ubiquinone/menaquinone biosynthesis C-methylase UbiE